jgi:hypothetical protein
LQAGRLYRFVWTQTGFPGCPPTTDTVNIDNRAALVNKIDTATKTICSGQTITVAGQVPSGGSGSGYSYQWESSTNGILFSPISGATLQNITLTPAGTMYLRRFVDGAPCAGYSDTVLIVVQAAFPTTASPQMPLFVLAQQHP